MRGRLVLAFALVALVGISLIGLYGYQVARDYIHTGVESRYIMHARISDQAVENTLREVRSNVSFAANSPALQGLIRARDHGGTDPVGGMSYTTSVAYLETLFVGIAEAYQRFRRLRYLDASGVEVVRVDYDGTRARRSLASALQRGTERSPFQAAMRLAAGQTYVSPIRLDREDGQVLVPHSPLANYAMPVFNARGERRGAIVFSVQADTVFHQSAIQQPREKDVFLFVADPSGHYHHHSAYPEKEFGGPDDLNTGQGLRSDFPEAADRILSGESGEAYTTDREIFYSPIRTGRTPGDFLVLGIAVPRSAVAAAVRQFSWVFAGVLTLSLILATSAGLVAARGIARPLEALRAAALRIHAGGDLQRKVQVSGAAEVVDLANAFNQMTSELQRSFDEIKVYRDVFNCVGEAVVISDLQSRIVEVNPAFETMTGYSRAEVLGRKPSILKSRHSTPQFYRAMWATILVEGGWAGEIVNRTRSGVEWDSLLTISALKDERGRPAGYVGINRDITRKKNLERELRAYATRLEETYLNTLRALSAALDLRDRETEGHSQRVTDMTLKLARAVGLSEEELVHVQRGAIVHDIGKMGVPDAILLKPGGLTAEEWVVMRKHPQYAYDMLSPIAYLRAALDIPYCHHERWDGTGYPRGLRGEQIPLAARLFAVVDVWDALRSDRPYRKGLTQAETLAHIRSLAGSHFDPNIVDLFLILVDDTAGDRRAMPSAEIAPA